MASRIPVDGFQPNLTGSIPMGSCFKFENKKGVAPLGGIKGKNWVNLKKSSHEATVGLTSYLIFRVSRARPTKFANKAS